MARYSKKSSESVGNAIDRYKKSTPAARKRTSSR